MIKRSDPIGLIIACVGNSTYFKNLIMENKKECLHEFESVYYGSEWAVECKNCGKDVYDAYKKDDANKIINERILKSK